MSKDPALKREAKQEQSPCPQRHHQLRAPLLQVWWTTLVSLGDMIVPLHHQGWCMFTTPNGEMPC